jgi:hypothetical protein
MDIPQFHDRREQVARHPRGKLRAVVAKSPRNLSHVDAVVLHSMSFDRGNRPLELYDAVKAHFAVLRDGTVIWLHAVEEFLKASGRFNARGIAIEFSGNPVSDRGTAFREKKFGRHIATLPQILSGRALVRALKTEFGLTHIFAHRQTDGGDRGNCPGPHVWFNVGAWATRTIGLSDGGPGFFVGRGKPINSSWRDASRFDVLGVYQSALEHGLTDRAWGLQPIP